MEFEKEDKEAQLQKATLRLNQINEDYPTLTSPVGMKKILKFYDSDFYKQWQTTNNEVI